MGRIIVFLFPVTPYFIWKAIAGERAADLASTPSFLHQAKMFATILEWLGLQRLSQGDLILLAMALFAAATLFGLATARVMQGASFGWLGNGSIGLSGAIAALAFYANHTRWMGGADFTTAILVCFVGATMVLLLAMGVKLFLVFETRETAPRPATTARSKDRIRQFAGPGRRP